MGAYVRGLRRDITGAGRDHIGTARRSKDTRILGRLRLKFAIAAPSRTAGASRGTDGPPTAGVRQETSHEMGAIAGASSWYREGKGVHTQARSVRP